MKTKSGAKKRFKVSANGDIKRKHAYHSHILTKKAPKRKRELASTTSVDKSDKKSVEKMLKKR